MVPQAIGISLCNRIGDSAGEFLVVVLWGLFYRHSMNLNCSFSLVSVLGLGACMPGRVWLVWSLSQPVCLPWFYAPFFLYASFELTIAYTRKFIFYFHVYMWVYYEQSRMPLVLPSRGRLIVVGWIWMIAESLMILLESVYTSISDQRRFFLG